MALTLTVAPAEEPVTLAEAKAHLRVTDADSDTLITTLIKTARLMAEGFTNRAFVTQTWQWRLDGFFPWRISVPKGRLQSVSSIQYVDANGDTQTLASSDYSVDAKSDPGRIEPAYGKVWPTTRYQMNAVTITFVAGYGAASAVPEDIKHAMLLIIGELYERREEAIAGTIIGEVPLSSKRLLMPHTLIEFA